MTTFGAVATSASVKSRPARRRAPTVRKYPGVTVCRFARGFPRQGASGPSPSCPLSTGMVSLPMGPLSGRRATAAASRDGGDACRALSSASKNSSHRANSPEEGCSSTATRLPDRSRAESAPRLLDTADEQRRTGQQDDRQGDLPPHDEPLQEALTREHCGSRAGRENTQRDPPGSRRRRATGRSSPP